MTYVPIDSLGKELPGKQLKELSVEACIALFVISDDSGIDKYCGDKLRYCVVQGERPLDWPVK